MAAGIEKRHDAYDQVRARAERWRCLDHGPGIPGLPGLLTTAVSPRQHTDYPPDAPGRRFAQYRKIGVLYHHLQHTNPMIRSLALSLLLLLTLSAVAQTKTVKALYDEYRQNRALFQSTYGNKTLTVSGKIRSISRASDVWKDADVHRIHLTATGYENFVVCEVPYRDSATVQRLKAGDYITVTGTVRAPVSDALFLSGCSFADAPAPVKRSTAPDNAPLGKYNVYQDNGSGFNFQYTFYLKSYTSYTLNGKPGKCGYNARSKTILFASGPLKGFAGLYRKTTDNEKDPPGFLLNAQGTVPDAAGAHRGYQFAYYQGK
ncbi:MAG: hypothetical protein EOO12_04935 [Chitinophagaceae bacterium]|nr:MAG: hypothetical protein EOO12_04935 [Chitinophagaceae bacterium]